MTTNADGWEAASDGQVKGCREWARGELNHFTATEVRGLIARIDADAEKIAAAKKVLELARQVARSNDPEVWANLSGQLSVACGNTALEHL